ncbi:PTS sugar transporter subunit IIA [Plantibacter sp. Mn2098]|uniref:PTS sugar transporter subunit IIA n=1 Tax=Plantibacter sp. Mn2098 TaxID=3395266 RepID=UPI003BD6BCE5
MSSQVLTQDQIKIVTEPVTKEQAMRQAADILEAAGAVTFDYYEAMLAREQAVSTYMGNLLAIPHGTNDAKDAVKQSALSFVRYENTIDWGGDEVRFVVGIAGKDGGHMEILSKIAIIFSEEEDVEKLLAATTPEELYALLGEVNE